MSVSVNGVCAMDCVLYLRSLSDVRMRLLLGLTQVPEVKNNQLILLLIATWLHLLHSGKQGKAIRTSIRGHGCWNSPSFVYLHAFENVGLLVIAQQGEVFLNGQLCSGRVQSCGYEINKSVLFQ